MPTEGDRQRARELAPQVRSPHQGCRCDACIHIVTQILAQLIADVREGQWVSVGERLPELHAGWSARVLVIETMPHGDRVVSVDRIAPPKPTGPSPEAKDRDEQWNEGLKERGGWESMWYVTHWRPLPAPPPLGEGT